VHRGKKIVRRGVKLAGENSESTYPVVPWYCSCNQDWLNLILWGKICHIVQNKYKGLKISVVPPRAVTIQQIGILCIAYKMFTIYCCIAIQMWLFNLIHCR